MARSRHPKREIEDSIRHAEAHGWLIKEGGSHAWGKMLCPYNDEACRCNEFCSTSIWSTPKNAGNHANFLRRVVNSCAHIRAKSNAERSNPHE